MLAFWAADVGWIGCGVIERRLGLLGRSSVAALAGDLEYLRQTAKPSHDPCEVFAIVHGNYEI